MIGFCEKIMYYTSSITDQQSFLDDRRTYDATLRNLELLGEAARYVPASVREAAVPVPWRDIIGMRNQLAHGYLGLDDDIVWHAVHNDVPILLRSLRRLSLELDG